MTEETQDTIEFPAETSVPEATTAEIITLPERAKALRIRSAASFAAGDRALATCKKLRKEVQSAFGPATERFREIKRQADAGRRDNEAKQAKFEGPIIEAEKIVRGRMLDYQNEQREIAEEKERKALAEATAKAEAEREAEAAALREEAERAKAEGDAKAAAEIEEQAAIAEAAPVAPVALPLVAAPPKGKHWHSTTTYKVELVNITALCAAIAGGHPQATSDLVKLDATAANKLARALKGNMNVPGLRVVKVQGSAVRG